MTVARADVLAGGAESGAHWAGPRGVGVDSKLECRLRLAAERASAEARRVK